MTKVLIVDDDEPLLRALRLNFSARGCQVQTAGGAVAGLAAAANRPPDLVVVDLRVHFANLRRKLEADPARPRHLITEPGLGYRLDVPPAAAP